MWWHIHIRLITAIFDLPLARRKVFKPAGSNDGCRRSKFDHISLWPGPVYIRSDSRHIQFVWTWLKIKQHLRYQKKFAWVPYRTVKIALQIPIRSEDTICRPPAVNVTKSAGCSIINLIQYFTNTKWRIKVHKSYWHRWEGHTWFLDDVHCISVAIPCTFISRIEQMQFRCSDPQFF